MFRNFGIWELLLVLLIMLLIFGATRLPQIGESLGKAIRGFRKGVSGDNEKKNEHLMTGKNGTDEAAKVDKKR